CDSASAKAKEGSLGFMGEPWNSRYIANIGRQFGVDRALAVFQKLALFAFKIDVKKGIIEARTHLHRGDARQSADAELINQPQIWTKRKLFGLIAVIFSGAVVRDSPHLRKRVDFRGHRQFSELFLQHPGIECHLRFVEGCSSPRGLHVYNCKEK